MKTNALIIYLLVIILPGFLLAQVKYSTDVDEEAKLIEQQLITPCCWNSTIAEHNSGKATEIKKDIRSLLATGNSRQEILDFYVKKYGVKILAVPPPEGFNLVGYILPVIFFAGGGALIIWGLKLMRKKSRRREETSTEITDEGGGDDFLEEKLREIS